MVLQKFTVGVAILAVLSTMVLAPLIEELLFRGIFSAWLGRFVEDQPLPATTSKEMEVPVGLETENTSLLGIGHTRHPRASRSNLQASSRRVATSQQCGRGRILESADSTHLDFLRGHASAPVACTYRDILAFHGTGTVYQRTGSLLASITMHATFNGINTLFLLLAAIGQHIQAPIPPAILAFPASAS